MPDERDIVKELLGAVEPDEFRLDRCLRAAATIERLRTALSDTEAALNTAKAEAFEREVKIGKLQSQRDHAYKVAATAHKQIWEELVDLKGRVWAVLKPWARLCKAVEYRDARDGLGGLEAEKQIHRLTSLDFANLAALARELGG